MTRRPAGVLARLVAALAAALLARAAAAGAAAPDPDLEAARTAWRYFERNVHPGTGLVSSVEGYPSTTAWDTGSSILAAVAAGELGLVEPDALRDRIARLLATLERLPLFRGQLPNKAYDAATGRMTDYRNRPAREGIGFSAVDVARLVSALVALGDAHPEAREAIARVLARWDLCPLARGGQLFGVHGGADGKLRSLQEGRLGYEQYAAKALALVGVDARRARSYAAHLAETTLLGVKVPHDARDFRRYGAVDALVTEPWALDALEFGPDPAAAPLAQQVFEVQKRRWQQTGIPTALSEDHVDRAPWFVYDAILADGAAWRTVDPEGREVAGLRSLSTKAAFALAALYPDDPYAAVLLERAAEARDPARGWLAGVYERGAPNRALSANTNGVVLESILYARAGPLHARCTTCAPWRARLAALASARTCPRADLGSGAPVPGLPGGPALGPGPGRGTAGAAPARRPGGPRLDGYFAATYRSDGPGVGGLATVWPWRSAFLRLGGEATPQAERGESRLLWGFGWDDWRPNTFSLTVHNWGPLRPEDAPGWRGAEANLGYKLPRLRVDWLEIAPVASVTVPFAGGPWADLRATFTIGGRLFAMGGIGRTIPGVFEGPPGTPDVRYFYGFGLWSWRPGSVFVTYHDWGPVWRDRNGVLSLGVNWAF
ncbi:MAG TPA: DUF3131 domain-containing protein [Anaeromyxobacter sp.]|nr:DUF3131 domain-containing protein [Anaeromyxobacter sp.]